jgi:tetratricopeptide (TPR) repeat protein
MLAALALMALVAQAPDIAAQAEAARDAGRVEEAIPLYRKALAAQPAWAEGWWSLGTLVYERDNYSEAAAAFAKASGLNPKAANAWVMLGLSEAKLGDNKAALEHIERGRAMDGGNDPRLRPVMLFTEGVLLLEAGQFGKAQEVLDSLARDGAGQDEFLVTLGCAVMGMNPCENGDLTRQAGRAERYAARQDVERAEQEYEGLARDHPKTHNVQFALGRFLLANHMDEEAVQAFQREIDNSPNHLLARLGIAGAKASSDPAGGLPYARQAVELAPDLPEAHYLLGLLLLNTGQAKTALAELETARRGNPEDSRVYFHLARAYSELDRKEDAARAREEFVRLEKRDTPSKR